MEILLNLTGLLLLTQKWRYTILSKHIYFWAISTFLSDQVTNLNKHLYQQAVGPGFLV